MKMNRLILALLLLAAVAGFAPTARAAGGVTIRGILISASNESGESDRRLAAYVPNLKRILRFESFKFLGEDSASISVPGNGELSLGNGQSVELTTESSDGKTVLLKVRWSAGVRHEYVLQRGGTTVLAGPSVGKGEMLAVILVSR
ncbi:MAG: hypothetical protein PSU94_15700 [Lacunisphaera sp.]|nr:hypothetical protein [Lacunisphaera sp.]